MLRRKMRGLARTLAVRGEDDATTAGTNSRGVRDYFDRQADGWRGRYDRSYFFRSRRELFRAALERHIVPEAKIALDFGCGSGPLTPLLADISTLVHALDLSEKMVETARAGLQQHPNINVGLIKELPDALYEVILCSSVIEYVPDDAGLIHNFACALRPGCLLLITFPNKYGALQSVQWMSGTRAEYLQHRAHLYDKKRIRSLMEPYFDILEKAAIGLPIFRQIGLGDLILVVAQKKGITHAPSHAD